MNKYNHKNRKRSLIAAGISLISIPAFSQNAIQAGSSERTGFTKIFDYDTTTWLMIFLFAIMALTIYVLYSSLKAVLSHYVKAESAKELVIAVKAESKKTKESFWTMFDRKFLTRAVPVEREADVMLDHNYDGIRELDNSLPPWWVWGFVLTIIFAVVYLLSYHVAGTGKLQLAEYQEELELAEKAKADRIKIAGENINEENAAFLTDATAIGEGKNIYIKNCVACHLADGGGQVGPNFTDEYWIHGGGAKNIFATIVNGVPEKGMISWKSQLSPKQIQQVTSYIHTFQGTTPAAPKEPQGDKWVETVTPAADSAAVPAADSTVKK